MKLRTAAATLVLGAAPLLAQTPQRPPTFEVGIEVINLNLSVTDGRNNYVTDLGEKDFAVFEDGIRQELSFDLEGSLFRREEQQRSAFRRGLQRRPHLLQAAEGLSASRRPDDKLHLHRSKS